MQGLGSSVPEKADELERCGSHILGQFSREAAAFMFDLLAVSRTDAGRGTDGRHLIHVVETAAGAPVALLRHGVATARRRHLSQRGASAEQWSKSGSRRGTLTGPVCAWRHALVDGGRIFIISEASERKGRNTTSQLEHFTTGSSLASFLLR